MSPEQTTPTWTVQIILCYASKDTRVDSSLQTQLTRQSVRCQEAHYHANISLLLFVEVCYIFRSRMFFQTTRASDNCNVQFSFQQRVSAQQRAEIITAARSGSSPYVSTNQPPISLGKRILGPFPGEISHNSR